MPTDPEETTPTDVTSADAAGDQAPTGEQADDAETLAEEVERLRVENDQLREHAEKSHRERHGRTPEERRHRRRHVASVALAILAALLLPLGVMTTWTRNQMLNTDRYVQTVTPLASDPAIQSALTNRVTALIVEEADFQGLAEEVLPEKAQPLAGFLAGGAENLVRTTTAKLLDTDEFQELWVKANRVGHEGAVAILTGEGTDLVTTEQGKVVLRIGPLVERVLKQLDTRFDLGLAERIPAEKLKFNFVLVDSPDLARLQGQIQLFNKLSYLTVILALGALIAAALVAEDRRLGVRRAGFAIAGSMFVLLLGYQAGRTIYLQNLPEGVQSPAAAEAIFDILTRFLHQAIRTMFVVGVVFVFVAWLVGPSAAAVRVRGWWNVAVGRAGSSGAELGPVPAWVSAHESAIRILIVTLAGVTVVAWERPTGKVVIGVLLVALVAIGLVQLLAAPARNAVPALADTSTGPSDRPEGLSAGSEDGSDGASPDAAADAGAATSPS